MELSTIIYGLVVVVCTIVVSIVFILAARTQAKLQKCPIDNGKCEGFRSVMGVNVDYREEEKNIKRTDSTPKRLTQYSTDASNEVAMIFIVALVKWITLPARREIPAGNCEADWRMRTWRKSLEDVGLPVELYEDVIDVDYRIIKALKTTLGDFTMASSKDGTTENIFIETRKQEFIKWIEVKGNFVADDVEKYMDALRQYSKLNKNISMDIKSYGEVAIIQPLCSTSPSASHTPLINDNIYLETQSSFNTYSSHQRIAFIILIIVTIVCSVALLLEEIWRLSPSDATI